MSNVIGPIDKDTWLTLRAIRGSVLFMEENNFDGRYDVAIEKESNIYCSLLEPLLKQAA